MFADPQIRHLQISQSVANSQLTEIPVLTQPLSLSRTPSKLDKAAPLIGEHTDRILTSSATSKVKSIICETTNIFEHLQ